MSISHTQGPWSLDQYHNVIGTNKQEIRAIGLVLTSGPEAKANSRLIAAAPTLLDALKAIVKSAELNQAAINSFLLMDAHEAIARATGDFS